MATCPCGRAATGRLSYAATVHPRPPGPQGSPSNEGPPAISSRNARYSSALIASEPVAETSHFDVLVIGSGASGLAAAVSAERAGARVALAAKGSLQSCNSAKAQGGIQAAFGEDDSPKQHAEDVLSSSHETANRQLVEVLTSEAPSTIH